MNAIDWINQKYHKTKNFPEFQSGDTVRVHVKIKEGEKERVQIYEGVVIRIHRQGAGSTFTVRKVSYGVGVERIFSFASPAIHKIDILNKGRVRRARLYYLRDLFGKKARIQARAAGWQLEDPTRPEEVVEKEKIVEQPEHNATKKEEVKASSIRVAENKTPKSAKKDSAKKPAKEKTETSKKASAKK